MRPKTTSLKKKQAIKRKNHGHWLTHKHLILAKRNIQTLDLQQLPMRDRNENEMKDSEVNDEFNYLSINDIINSINTELFADNLNNGLIDENVNEIDEDDIGFEDVSDDFDKNVYEQEDSYEQEQIEESLTEQQTEFADEFVNIDTSAIPVREYDELVSEKVLNIISSFQL
jgi:hypothetical protein